IDLAVNRLPERLRQATVLCDLQGYSLKEAAASLDCPVGTVESRLARARRRLRGLLPGAQPGVGGFVALGAGPPALRAATLRAAMSGEAAKAVITALASRAALQAGCGRALPASAIAAAAVFLAAAIALGHLSVPTAPSHAVGTVAA